MLTVLVILVLVIVGMFLWMKLKTAKNKRPEERSAIESIMVSASVKGRKNLEDTADVMRTAEISKEEGIQKTNDAINQLDRDFKKAIKDMMIFQSNISRDLENLKAQPKAYEKKARISKKKMQDAKDAGKSETVVSLHKKNAIMYLDMKAKAIERIAKAEKSLEEIETNLEITQATYENKKMILQDLKSEFQSMTSTISAAKFNDSLAQIQAIKKETVDKLTAQNAEIQAQNYITGVNESSSIDTAVSSGKYDEEFDNL